MGTDESVEVAKKPPPVFKNPAFQEQFRPISISGKKRTWRSLKQVLAQERALPWPADFVHCALKYSLLINKKSNKN